jgi:integrase
MVRAVDGLADRHQAQHALSIQLSDVTHSEVAAWIASLRSNGSAPSTVRQAHRVFSLLLDLAVRDGRLPRNPATRVPLPRATRDEPRFLTHDQVEHLAEAAGDDGDVSRPLAYTGLRFGEMAALRVRRVDFLRRRLVIAEAATEVAGRLEFGTPRTHQADGALASRRRGVAGPAVRRQARRRPPDHNAGRHSPAAAQLASDCVRPRRPSGRAGRRHTSRSPHTAASLAVSSGATIKAIQRMLGHASAAMTLDVYSGLFDDDLTALADRLDAAAQAAAEARVGAVWAPSRSDDPRQGKRTGQRGGPRGDRTHNPRIKSPLLCQLS